MGIIKLFVAAISVYLLALFIMQLYRIAWSMLTDKVEGLLNPYEVIKHPDDVDPAPIHDLSELGTWMELGDDRFGRTIYRSWQDGRHYYLDRTSRRRVSRMGARPTRARRDEAQRGTRLQLGWKGFDADSSPWEVLGVAKDASIEQIKAAYRSLVRKFHPDRFQNLSAPEIAALENDTKLIHAAYAELVKA